jgi:hypothetical protein
MKFWSGLAGAAASTVVMLAGSMANADVVVGTPEPLGGTCIPFGCLAALGGSTYQEIYDASAFSGPLQVDSVSFFSKFPGTLDTATYHVTFWETPQTVAGLSSTAAANRGAALSDFGTFSLSGPMPDTLTFNGSSFVYNPSHSNLLMQIDVSGFTASGGFSSYAQIDISHVTRRYFAFGGSATGSTDYDSLVTEFGTSASVAVPEPATWALMLIGFGGLGGAIRSARRRVSAGVA